MTLGLKKLTKSKKENQKVRRNQINKVSFFKQFVKLKSRSPLSNCELQITEIPQNIKYRNLPPPKESKNEEMNGKLVTKKSLPEMKNPEKQKGYKEIYKGF